MGWETAFVCFCHLSPHLTTDFPNSSLMQCRMRGISESLACL